MRVREAASEDAAAFRQLRYTIDSESDTWGADPDERFKTDADAEASGCAFPDR